MADFCKQCSINNFDWDFEDFKGLLTREQYEGGYFMPVLCEGCGPCVVDHTGKCHDPNCMKKHGDPDHATR